MFLKLITHVSQIKKIYKLGEIVVNYIKYIILGETGVVDNSYLYF